MANALGSPVAVDEVRLPEFFHEEEPNLDTVSLTRETVRRLLPRSSYTRDDPEDSSCSSMKWNTASSRERAALPCISTFINDNDNDNNETSLLLPRIAHWRMNGVEEETVEEDVSTGHGHGHGRITVKLLDTASTPTASPKPGLMPTTPHSPEDETLNRALPQYDFEDVFFPSFEVNECRCDRDEEEDEERCDQVRMMHRSNSVEMEKTYHCNRSYLGFDEDRCEEETRMRRSVSAPLLHHDKYGTQQHNNCFDLFVKHGKNDMLKQWWKNVVRFWKF